MPMYVSSKGLALIKQFESCKLESYLCPASKWTIGFGHTSDAGPPKVTKGMKITRVEAEAILARDVIQFVDAVNEYVKVELTQNQFDALVSFTFNVGAERLRTSTLLKRINAGRLDAVPAELMKWTKAKGKELPGLVRRRRAECELWRGLQGQPIDTDDARLEPDLPKPSKSILQSKEANAAAITGLMGTVDLASQVANQARTANDAMSVFEELVMTPRSLILMVIIAAAVGIWYWRKKRLEEEGA